MKNRKFITQNLKNECVSVCICACVYVGEDENGKDKWIDCLIGIKLVRQFVGLPCRDFDSKCIEISR